MAMDGFFALCCASAVLMATPSGTASAATPEDKDQAIHATLAVQTAIQQAREFLLRNDFRSAVYALEGQLSRINGNRQYLSMLQEAYRGYIKELRLARQEVQAQVYLDRLRILDPGAALDKALTGPAAVAAALGNQTQTKAPAAVASSGSATGARNANMAAPAGTIRLKGDEETDDPFHPSRALTKPNATPTLSAAKAKELLARAEQEFESRRYREARILYDQVHREDRSLIEGSRERWAYCKLSHVVEQMNQATPNQPLPEDLENEVRLALNLAPRLQDHGHSVLSELQKRRSQFIDPTVVAIPVKHVERNAAGWAGVETVNFRVFHNQPRDVAEKAARVAEATRIAMQRRWFGAIGPDWNPKCEVYLHATAEEYSRVTGVPTTSPGHSSIQQEAGRVVSMKIHLHCDNPNLLTAVLPHEATHAVLAGQFGDQMVPRWADEGMAVLSEPRDKIDRHLQQLPKCRQEGTLLRLRDVMTLNDYPDPRYITAFYAQGVSVVDFLTKEKGTQLFSEFLREGMRIGYEPALLRFYNFRGFEELEQRWMQFAFGSAGSAGTMARGQ